MKLNQERCNSLSSEGRIKEVVKRFAQAHPSCPSCSQITELLTHYCTIYLSFASHFNVNPMSMNTVISAIARIWGRAFTKSRCGTPNFRIIIRTPLEIPGSATVWPKSPGPIQPSLSIISIFMCFLNSRDFNHAHKSRFTEL